MKTKEKKKKKRREQDSQKRLMGEEEEKKKEEEERGGGGLEVLRISIPRSVRCIDSWRKSEEEEKTEKLLCWRTRWR